MGGIWFVSSMGAAKVWGTIFTLQTCHNRKVVTEASMVNFTIEDFSLFLKIPQVIYVILLE